MRSPPNNEGVVKRVGRYELLEQIASGGMAEIWRARLQGPAEFERFVAIKRILPAHVNNDSVLRMFLDEARTCAPMSHSNIVQIIELGEVENTYFIAMEFIEGQHLASIIGRGIATHRPLAPQLAALIVAETCKGLHYAHHLTGSDGTPLEIVHRDISPQNIIVTYEGAIKIVDFGVAKAKLRLEQTAQGILKGKYGYMSPEQVNGHEVDMRSDLFSLGIVLYELCTGERLFPGHLPRIALDMIAECQVTRPSQIARGISKSLETIIMRALEKDPNDRFQTAGAMQEELERCLREYDDASSTTLANYLAALFPPGSRKQLPPLQKFESVLRDHVTAETSLPPDGGDDGGEYDDEIDLDALISDPRETMPRVERQEGPRPPVIPTVTMLPEMKPSPAPTVIRPQPESTIISAVSHFHNLWHRLGMHPGWAAVCFIVVVGLVAGVTISATDEAANTETAAAIVPPKKVESPEQTAPVRVRDRQPSRQEERLPASTSRVSAPPKRPEESRNSEQAARDRSVKKHSLNVQKAQPREPAAVVRISEHDLTVEGAKGAEANIYISSKSVPGHATLKIWIGRYQDRELPIIVRLEPGDYKLKLSTPAIVEGVGKPFVAGESYTLSVQP